MGFTTKERTNALVKVLLAEVKDANSAGQWYESRLFAGKVIDSRQVWAQLSDIEANPAANLATAQANAAGALNGIIDDLSQAASAIRLTAVPSTNNSTWAALTTYGDWTSARLKSWVQPQQAPLASGAASVGYAVRLFEGDPAGAGVEVITTDGSTGTGVDKTVGWVFDYSNGVLLLSDDFKSTITDPYILGFRYIGSTGGSGSGGGLEVTTSNMQLYVNGTGGSDSDDGLSALTAKETLQAAFDLIPYGVMHNVTINVVGTCDEQGDAYLDKLIAQKK